MTTSTVCIECRRDTRAGNERGYPSPAQRFASAHIIASDRRCAHKGPRTTEGHALRDVTIRLVRRKRSSGQPLTMNSPAKHRDDAAETVKVAPTPAKPRRICKTCSSTAQPSSIRRQRPGSGSCSITPAATCRNEVIVPCGSDHSHRADPHQRILCDVRDQSGHRAQGPPARSDRFGRRGCKDRGPTG
jgi:hypothetical protein